MTVLFDNYEALPAEHTEKAHLPIGLLVDRSISMSGAMSVLNKTINRFADDICKDPNAKDMVDVCVIGFNGDQQVVVDWRPIDKMPKVDMVAEGSTDITAALNFILEKTHQRTEYYKTMGIECRMPMIIMLTDGYGGDVTEVAKTIEQRTNDKLMQLWVLAVKGYDEETVAKLTKGVRVYDLVDEDGYDFTDFFDIMAVGIKAVSNSSPGERIRIPKTHIHVPNLEKWLND